MAMELHLSQKQSQQMVITPQLQQAIKLLQMNHQELTEEITNEMMSNPLLELTGPADSPEGQAENGLGDPDYDQTPDKPSEGGTEFAEASGASEETIREDIDWENYLDEYSSGPSGSLASGSHETPEEIQGFETYTAAKTTLTDHLISQWRFVARDREDYLRGDFIIGNINDDGYLAADADELARLSGSKPELILRTLSRVQELEPPGIAARDLRECLLLQLKRRNLEDSLAYLVCRDHLKLLEKKDLPGLCRALRCEREEATEALALLKTLNPRPGLAYSSADSVYITPDVYISRLGDDYVITLNEDGMPRLRFSKAYLRLLTDSGAGTETRKYLADKLKGAKFLIRSVHQRQRTIYRVTECIFRIQRDFLEKGVEFLKPLVLRDVADELGFHESTISRVTTNKYVDTPRGVFELKYFFDSPISRFQGESLSSESVKNRIRQIISAEDPKKPLSDQKIVEILRGSNIDIARRTVAKYRELLGLGSSSERRRLY
ncbi:MAG: RNA polymerase factor sigma-54 [Deltaproteobacteria bacterium]|jgi:RNA polymerase sigma-54 factor|nr:RNA polymerase factor sigma-54 [Deltaproteobacteria bacterium]